MILPVSVWGPTVAVVVAPPSRERERERERDEAKTTSQRVLARWPRPFRKLWPTSQALFGLRVLGFLGLIITLAYEL